MIFSPLMQWNFKVHFLRRGECMSSEKLRYLLAAQKGLRLFWLLELKEKGAYVFVEKHRN